MDGPGSEYAKYRDQVGVPPALQKVSCGQQTVDGLRVGLVGGLIMGGLEGALSARNLPLRGLGIANHVLLRSLVNGASLGIAYGGFKGIRCGLERQRGRQDLLNSAAAGSVSWAFLAATMSRGDRRTVAIGAVIGAVAMPLFDSFAIKVHTHPGGVPPGQGPRPGGGESADV